MITTEYLENFETSLRELLLERCKSAGYIENMLLEADELDEIWRQVAPEYMADAMPLINDYPSVAIAWAAYFGMAMAAIWDGAWDDYKDRKDIYTSIRDVRGFDEMDEYILEEMLGINLLSPENIKLEETLRSLAQSAISRIFKEQIEAQTSEAFYVFASTAKILYKIGISIELKELGYRYHKVDNVVS